MIFQTEISDTYFWGPNLKQRPSPHLRDVLSVTPCWVARKFIRLIKCTWRVYAYCVLSRSHFFPSRLINSAYINPNWFLSITMTSNNLFSCTSEVCIIIMFPHIVLVSDNFQSSSFYLFFPNALQPSHFFYLYGYFQHFPASYPLQNNNLLLLLFCRC